MTIFAQITTRGQIVPSFLFKGIQKELEKRITKLLEEKFKEEEFSSLFILDIKFDAGPKKLEVFLDGDHGLNLDHCARLNRYLQNAIDEAGWLGEKYFLDVSSPGATLPLQIPRQYNKHVGRKLKVKLNDDTEFEGKLVSLTEETIQLYWKERIKEGKKKVVTEINKEIAFADIKKAVVQISFN